MVKEVLFDLLFESEIKNLFQCVMFVVNFLFVFVFIYVIEVIVEYLSFIKIIVFLVREVFKVIFICYKKFE